MISKATLSRVVSLALMIVILIVAAIFSAMTAMRVAIRGREVVVQDLTGKTITRLYVMNGAASPLLNYFTANALKLPVVVLPTDVTAIGNIVVQALALGHINSLEQAREMVRRSMKTQTIMPHGNWQMPYSRFSALMPVTAS